MARDGGGTANLGTADDFEGRVPVRHRLRAGAAAFGLGLLALLAACSDFSFGPSPDAPGPAVPLAAAPDGELPPAAGESIGTGPVRVALLLPLSGDRGLVEVGTSMANSARLAMAFIAASPSINDNITIVIKDTAGNSAVAANRASEAIAEGASLILGPLRADSVRAVGQVARQAGVPVIAFSNNAGAAAPGVFLLNVLPEVEVARALGFVRAEGRGAFAAIVPTTDFGRVQEGAFRQAAADQGLNIRGVYSFSSEAEARAAVQQVIPLIEAGAVDALFLPDRATAPSFGALLEEAGIDRGRLTVIGSADWDGDGRILQTGFLAGAVYPAVDPAGFEALRPEYQARFGAVPHPLATIAYTATLLANTSTLARGTPRYDRAQLTRPSGYSGRDGLFRLSADGRSQYALVIKRIGPGGAAVVDGARL